MFRYWRGVSVLNNGHSFSLRQVLRIFRRAGIGLVHLAVVVLVFAIAVSASRQQTAKFQLTKGQKAMFAGYKLIYNSFRHENCGSVLKVGPEIVLVRGNKRKIIWPYSAIYHNQQRTAEVAVYSSIKEDVYLVFNGVGPDRDVEIQAMLKPMMCWLWIAMFLIAIGSFFILAGTVKTRKTVTSGAGQSKHI